MLGPIIFLIFINDLLSITDSSIHYFADDTTIHASYQFNRPPSSSDVSVAREKVAQILNM